MTNNIDSIHFMNSSRDHPGIYSCAIDAFLEVSHAVLYPLLLELDTGYFLDCLYHSCDLYESVLNNAVVQFSNHVSHLSDIREIVWSVLRERCPSFTAQDANAQFSEIFQERVFDYFTTDERHLLVSTFIHRAFCSTCQLHFIKVSEIFVHYVTLNNFMLSGLNLS